MGRTAVVGQVPPLLVWLGRSPPAPAGSTWPQPSSFSTGKERTLRHSGGSSASVLYRAVPQEEGDSCRSPASSMPYTTFPGRPTPPAPSWQQCIRGWVEVSVGGTGPNKGALATWSAPRTPQQGGQHTWARQVHRAEPHLCEGPLSLGPPLGQMLWAQEGAGQFVSMPGFSFFIE